jgi:uncharacterized integral membrane protein
MMRGIWATIVSLIIIAILLVLFIIVGGKLIERIVIGG